MQGEAFKKGEKGEREALFNWKPAAAMDDDAGEVEARVNLPPQPSPKR
jgi:hypothetical protein